MANTILDAENFFAEFKGSGLLFEQALAQTDMAVCITDPRLPDNPIVFANEAFLDISGYRLTEVLGRNCRFLQGSGTNQEHLEKLRNALRTQTSVVVELQNYRKNGTPFWNALHVAPVHDEAGELIYYFGSQMDVTDVHEAREVEGRSPQMSARVKSFLGSIGAALAPRKPATSQDVRVSISEIIEQVLSSYHDGNPGRYSSGGPHLMIKEENVGAVGLCLHELASRAARSGVWKREGGQVAIRWLEPKGQCLTLEWIEDHATARTGEMARLPVLSALVDSLSGSMVQDATPKGCRIELHLPLSEDADC